MTNEEFNNLQINENLVIEVLNIFELISLKKNVENQSIVIKYKYKYSDEILEKEYDIQHLAYLCECWALSKGLYINDLYNSLSWENIEPKFLTNVKKSNEVKYKRSLEVLKYTFDICNWILNNKKEF